MFTWGDGVTVTCSQCSTRRYRNILHCRNDVGLGSGVATQCRMEICLRLCGITEVTPLGIHKSPLTHFRNDGFHEDEVALLAVD